MKKLIVTLFAVITCLFAMTLTVSADEWVKTDKGYKYQYDNGTYAKAGWLNVDGKKYYIKSNGTRAKGWLTTKNGTKYYFGKDGAALKGWYKIGGKKYYFDKNCKMATGEIIIGDTLYYFHKDGTYDDYCYAVKLNSAQKKLRIHDKGVYDINSVGGVDVEIVWENRSEKVVKYIYFTVTPINAVGDAVECRITRESKKILKSTGPFEQFEGGYIYLSITGEIWGDIWENVWYNGTVDHIQINSVEIEYMDGTSTTISGKDLNSVYY